MESAVSVVVLERSRVGGSGVVLEDGRTVIDSDLVNEVGSEQPSEETLIANKANNVAGTFRMPHWTLVGLDSFNDRARHLVQTLWGDAQARR